MQQRRIMRRWLVASESWAVSDVNFRLSIAKDRHSAVEDRQSAMPSNPHSAIYTPQFRYRLCASSKYV